MNLEELKLCSSQLRANDHFHNAGWYTADGVKVGWGDLSLEDLSRLARLVTQPFIILYESDSYWAFTTFEKRTEGIYKVTDSKETTPGTDYVLEKAAAVILPITWVVHPGEILVKSMYDDRDGELGEGSHENCTIKFRWSNTERLTKAVRRSPHLGHLETTKTPADNGV